MVDSASLFDLKGKKVPDIWGILSFFLLTILIADLQFTGFRLNELGLIVTASMFAITLISALGFINIPFTEGHLLDGAFGFTLGAILLNIGNLVANIRLSILSSATTSYLSGVLPEDAGIVTEIVNNVFAPIGETFLIFGFAAGIRDIIEATRLSNLNLTFRFLIVALPPSLLFAVLHGTRSAQFFLLAFGLNMIWTAVMYYGELTRMDWVKVTPIGLGLIAGLHFGFNVSNGGGLIQFIGNLLAATGGSYGRSATAILLYLAIIFGLGFVRLYIVVDERWL